MKHDTSQRQRAEALRPHALSWLLALASGSACAAETEGLTQSTWALGAVGLGLAVWAAQTWHQRTTSPAVAKPLGTLPDLESSMLDHSAQLFGWLGPDGQVLHMNRTGTQWLQVERLPAEALWQWPSVMNNPGQAQRLQEAVQATSQQAFVRIELRLPAAGADERQIEMLLRRVRNQALNTECVLLEGRDITVRRQTEDKLMLAATVFEQAREGILITDPQGEILSVNQAFSDITGYDSSDVQGQTPAKLAQALGAPHLHRRIVSALNRQGHWQGEVRSLRRNGESFTAWVSLTRRVDTDGRITHLIGIINDITQAKEVELKLHRQANFDTLTDLPNRRSMEQSMQRLIDKAGRDGEPLSVLFLDLNQFRDINDNFGHRTGDAVLVEIAHRLREDLRQADIVARLGGDEFAVVLHSADAEAAHQVACKLQERIAQPCMVHSHELSLTLSIGVAVFPEDGTSVELLARNAETAMYRAKQEGRGTCCFFAQGMQPRSVRHLQLEAALRRAIERNELLLHYQPQLDTVSRQVVGLEALVRWRHPELGMVSPADFIPLAEHNGQIVAIGEWVMRTAAAQMRQWMDLGLPPLVMAVNLSAVQFRDPELPSRVESILADTGLPAQCLELELTESVATGNPMAAIAMMDRLHALGVRLSIDDFGTGYSSLNYLKRFRIDTLKIDQSFVRDIGTDPDDRAIVQAIIQMAHALNLSTIAEGVETDEQADFLQAHGCDMLQGYRFCRPVEPGSALSWLQERLQLPASGA